MSAWFEDFGFAQVGPHLYMGAYPQDAEDVAALSDAGITAVFNLVQDVEYELPGGREACATALAEQDIREERLEVVDYGNLLPGHIERAVTTVLAWLADGETVYVHCRAGMQRSAVVSAAVVAIDEDLEPLAALDRVRARNPQANPLAHQRQDLLRWWDKRAQRTEPAG